MKEANSMTPAKFIAARQALGLTQTEFGKRIGVTKRQVIRMEKGDTPIRATYAELIRYIESAPDAIRHETGD
jgi:DNA-binding XRE family transcriptional regulator